MSLGGDLAWLRQSSTLRLAVLLSAIFAVGMAVAAAVTIAVGSDVFERRVDTTLQALANASDLENGRGDSFGVILRTPEDLDDLPRPFARVAARGGGTIELDQNFRQSDTWRLLVSADAQGGRVVVAVPLDDGEDALELLGGILWITVATIIVLTLIVGLVTGILAQRRLTKINRTLTALASGDLSARTGIRKSRDDLDKTARQVDVTADELERLVAQTRHLSASLAHDLRTPLARLRSRLEMLPDGEARAAALEESERLAGIFDTIMRVARIEAAQGDEGFEEVSLGALIEDLAETYHAVIEDDDKVLSVNVIEAAIVKADRQMLVQAIANLIQNALRYGGQQITLKVHGHTICVADDGPGVDPREFSEIIKPMVRLDRARKTEGTGLGLALVRAVAERHGAALEFTESKPKGLAVCMKFAEL